MTTASTEQHATTADTVRQWVVLVSLIVAIVGSAIGSGVFGGVTMPEAAGGALRADATLIAPAVPAFSIWSVIYLGLAALSIWQLLPSQKTDARQRTMGFLIAASLVLNAAWILVIQAGLLAVSVVVIAALVVVLTRLFILCVKSTAKNWVEALLVDGVLGLYLGWVTIAAVATSPRIWWQSGLTVGGSIRMSGVSSSSRSPDLSVLRSPSEAGVASAQHFRSVGVSPGLLLRASPGSRIRFPPGSPQSWRLR